MKNINVFNCYLGKIKTMASIVGVKSVYLSIFLSIFLGLQSFYAHAVICIPPGVGVPYSSGKVPKWFQPAASVPANAAAIYHRIDDPRWKTSLRIGNGEGATEHLGFRALHDTEGGTQSMYLSWWVKVSPGIDWADATDHELYVGLKPAAGSNKILLQVNLTDASTTANSPTQINADVKRVGTASNPDQVSTRIDPDPSWTGNIHVWVEKRRVSSDASALDPNMWAINVHVPIGVDLGDGVILGTDFEMFYEVFAPASGGAAINYSWPQGANITIDALERKILPPTTDWEDFNLSSGISDPSCATGGITIEAIDIGTTDSRGQSYINPNATNVFFARPTNKTAAPIPAENIHARFRLANWGTQPVPTDVTNPDQLWTDIRGLGDVTQSAAAGDIAPNDPWDIQGSWTPTAATDPEWFDGSRDDHQCMLVNLSGSYVFLKSSVHRNMNFEPASTFTEEAEVSIVGLAPLSADPRDVYLFVETNNMPRRVENSDPKLTTKPELLSAAGQTNASQDDERSKIDQMADYHPTYVVHAYYDTGRTITRNGKTQIVLKPMTSYGYFMKHEGDLSGWKHDLAGVGVELVEIHPNFYKLSVANNGTATIKNTIEAVEHGWAMNAKIGVNDPQGNLGNFVDSGLSINLGLEYFWSPAISYEAILGFHSFDDKGLGSDLDISQFSLNARYYFAPRVVRPYVNGGIGSYKLDPGSSETGYNVGAGIQYDLTSSLYIEAAYNYHDIDATNPDPKFSTLQIGLGYLF